MRIVRKIALALLLLLASLAAVVYFLYLRPAALKPRVAAILRQYLIADVRLGSASLHPLEGLTLQGISVRRSGGGPLLFRADRLRVRPRWSALARLTFQVKELSLQHADLRFERDSEGRSNWRGVIAGAPSAAGAPPPIFSLSRGTVTIGEHVFQGLTCELAPFPTEKLVAIRGTVDDPFWGSFAVSGQADLGAEGVRISFESRDLQITEGWMTAIPLVGRDVWERYRPAGTFDLSGTVTVCRGEEPGGDYSLVFTAKDSSCRYLVFPVTGATGRVFVDSRSVIVNHLDGELFGGRVEGYSIVNLDAPCTYFNRYAFEDVEIRAFVRRMQPTSEGIGGSGTGYVTFQGDHCLGTFEGKGEIIVSDARLWKLPVIVVILSRIQSVWPSGSEPAQTCTIRYTLTEKGIAFDEISLSSEVLDLYGMGTATYDGEIDLTFYARLVSKSPLFLADYLLQPALDRLSGNLAQFRVTGTASNPSLAVVPLTAVSRNISTFFDTLTRGRQGADPPPRPAAR